MEQDWQKVGDIQCQRVRSLRYDRSVWRPQSVAGLLPAFFWHCREHTTSTVAWLLCSQLLHPLHSGWSIVLRSVTCFKRKRIAVSHPNDVDYGHNQELRVSFPWPTTGKYLEYARHLFTCVKLLVPLRISAKLIIEPACGCA